MSTNFVEKGDVFIDKTPEKEDLNQYWYSAASIAALASEAENAAGETGVIACMSTPSIYFSLSEDVRNRSYVLDLDEIWANDRGFLRYDFNHPEELPSTLHGTVDVVVIDPPFITHEVWRKYAEAAKLLLRPGGKVIGTTIVENAALLEELFDAKPTPFMPSIPHLVYQYNSFTNFEPTTGLAHKNPEIPDWD